MPDPQPILEENPLHGAASLQHLVDAGRAGLPLPGGGATLARWRAFAAIAGHDLPLAKLFESHADALAILAELEPGFDVPAGSTWGVWCAEPPSYRVSLVHPAPAVAQLSGTKAWCSGAAQLSHAIVSAWDAQGRQCLAAVQLDQPGVRVTGDGWHAVGMAATGSVDVVFSAARAVPVGGPGDYTARAGFWMGGAGIAACWWGAAAGIAMRVRRAVRERAEAGRSDPHLEAHLGAIDAALAPAAALLRECARRFDDAPGADARTLQALAGRARAAAEHAATEVLLHAGRALGAAPLCREERFARLMADLPVFLRQSHAEHDLAALGRGVAQQGDAPWIL